MIFHSSVTPRLKFSLQTIHPQDWPTVSTTEATSNYCVDFCDFDLWVMTFVFTAIFKAEIGDKVILEDTVQQAIFLCFLHPIGAKSF